jgi:hypothetical protein
VKPLSEQLDELLSDIGEAHDCADNLLEADLKALEAGSRCARALKRVLADDYICRACDKRIRKAIDQEEPQ